MGCSEHQNDRSALPSTNKTLISNAKGTLQRSSQKTFHLSALGVSHTAVSIGLSTQQRYKHDGNSICSRRKYPSTSHRINTPLLHAARTSTAGALPAAERQPNQGCKNLLVNTAKSGVAPGDHPEDVVGRLPRTDQHQRHAVARPTRRPAEPETVHRGVLGPGPEQRQLVQAVGQTKHGTSAQVVPANDGTMLGGFPASKRG